MKINSERGLIIALVISMIIWGMSWSSAKVLSAYGDSISIAFIRFTFTFIALFVLLKTFSIPLTIKRKGLLPLLAAGVFMAGYGLLFFNGLQVGSPGAAGVLVTIINPIFAYSIGFIINKKTPSKQESLGLILGILAGGILLKIWLQYDLIVSSGNLYFVIAALVWAIMSKFSSKSNSYGHSLTFTFWMHAIGITCLLPFINLNNISQTFLNGDQLFWSNISYFSVINSAGATSFFLYATTKLGAEKASGFVFMVPCSAAIAAWLFLGEQITLTTFTGGVIGVIAVFIMQGRLSKSQKLKPKTR